MGTVLRTQSGWRICAAGTRTKHKIKPIVFEVYTRDQACFRLFLSAWYGQHRNSYFDRVQQIPWNGVSQDLMRFWNYGSLFWTIIAGVLCSSELGFIFFCFCATMLDKETWRKDCWSIPFLHMFSCLVSIYSKMWIQQQTSCLHQRLVFHAWFWYYGGSYLFDKYSSLHMWSLNNIYTVAILGQTLLESRRAVP